MNATLRRHYPWLILFVVVILILTLALGEARVIAYTVKGSATPQAAADGKKDAKNFTNKVSLYDTTVVHSIQILIPDSDYQKMLTTYRTTGVKDWFQADVVIDGVKIEKVGLRLKGNASLKTALGRGMSGQGGQLGQPPAGGNLPFEGQPPAGGFGQKAGSPSLISASQAGSASRRDCHSAAGGSQKSKDPQREVRGIIHRGGCQDPHAG